MFDVRWTMCRNCFLVLCVSAVSPESNAHGTGLTVPDAQQSQTSESEDLLKQLLLRDRLFDDVQFRYEKTRTESMNLQVLTLQELERRAENPLIDNKSDGFTEILRGIGTMPPSFPAKYSCDETMSVRGGVAAFEHTQETQNISDIDEDTQRVVDFYSGRTAPAERWSNSDGLMMSSIVLPNQEILLKATGAGPLAAMERQKMIIQFMMGYGFGTRLKKIRAVTRESGQTTAEGVIEVWFGDESTCRLVIDDTLLVREATIESDVKGNRNTFSIHTEGVLNHNGLPALAKSGTFRRTWLGTESAGNADSHSKVKEDVAIDLLEVSHPIDGSEFARATEFTVAEGVVIHDLTRDKTTTVANLGQAIVSKSSRALSIIILNVTLLAGLLLIYGYRRFVKRPASAGLGSKDLV